MRQDIEKKRCVVTVNVHVTESERETEAEEVLEKEETYF